jgi:hypothetical protein
MTGNQFDSLTAFAVTLRYRGSIGQRSVGGLELLIAAEHLDQQGR